MTKLKSDKHYATVILEEAINNRRFQTLIEYILFAWREKPNLRKREILNVKQIVPTNLHQQVLFLCPHQILSRRCVRSSMLRQRCVRLSLSRQLSPQQLSPPPSSHPSKSCMSRERCQRGKASLAEVPQEVVTKSLAVPIQSTNMLYLFPVMMMIMATLIWSMPNG